MKYTYKFILFAFLSLGLGGNLAYGQCSGGSLAGNLTITPTFQTTGCVVGGDYYTFSATAGTTYLFSFCQGGGSATFDTQLTILDNTGAYAGGYNDDNCGLQSEISWNCPTTGTYRILINNYFCTTGVTCATLAYREMPPAGPGATCGNPMVIASLPYNQTGMTTCGFGDDYSSLDACGSSYMNGDDYVFTYTNTGPETITITLSNTNTYTGVFVLDGCPNAPGTNCVPLGPGGGGACTGAAAATNTNFAGNPFGTWELCTPGTYYIVVSTFPSPQCTPFDINITTVPGCLTPPAPVVCYAVDQAIPYAPDPYNLGTIISFPDDQHSSVVPIGFSFCFMGIDYTDVVVSSNGYLQFSTACAGTYSSYVTVPIPTNTPDEVMGTIMGPWQDIDPSVGGNLRYATVGTAPNRRFVVNFESVPMFSVSCNAMLFTGQITLYETTNIIDNYIQNKPVCTSWNSGNAVQGLNGPLGLQAVPVAGRNNTNWTATNDAVRFSPTCAPCNPILPANYLHLSGKNEDKQNVISWETSMEDGIESFVLERSLNGKDFSEVGTAPAMGDVARGAAYRLVDHQPFFPATYYRLRELGANGEVSYSEVISVLGQEADLFMDYHQFNEQNGMLALGLTSYKGIQDVTVRVLTVNGQTVAYSQHSLQPGSNTIDLDLSSFASGMYLIEVSNGVSFKEVRRVAVR